MKNKILVVDDDVDFQLQLRMQLEHAGFDVLTAEDVPTATQLFEDHRPDLAIVDLMLQNSDDGFVLCHRLKRLSPSFPIIIVTSVTQKTRIDFDAVTDEERSWIKADVLMHKPVRLEALKAEIGRLLPGSA